LTDHDLVRAAGIVGLVGAVCGGVGDLFLTYNASVPGGVPTEWDSVRDLVRTIDHRNLMIGHYVGVLGMPLSVLGFYNVYKGCEPAGKAWSLPLILGAAWLYCVGNVYHGQLALLGAAEAGGADAATIARFYDGMWPLLGVQAAGLFLASVLFFVVIAFRPTRFPRWAAALTPLIVAGVLEGIAWVSPEPVRMAISVSVFHCTTFIIIAASTALTWRAP
jgi:hypothetical protein